MTQPPHFGLPENLKVSDAPNTLPDVTLILTQIQIREWLASHQKRLRVGDDLPPINEVANRAGVHRDTLYACMAGDRINLRSQYALSRVITELEEEMQGKVRTRLMSISLSGGQAKLRFGIGLKLLPDGAGGNR
jgi:hypothetical protein